MVLKIRDLNNLRFSNIRDLNKIRDFLYIKRSVLGKFYRLENFMIWKNVMFTWKTDG